MKHRLGKKRYFMRNTRNGHLLRGKLNNEGCEIWHHYFCGKNDKTGEIAHFFIDFMLLNHTNTNAICAGEHCGFIRVTQLGTKGKSIMVAISQDDLTMSRRVLSLRFANNICLEDYLKGYLIQDQQHVLTQQGFSQFGSVSFDLKVQKKLTYNLGFSASRVLRWLQIFDMYWHVGGLTASFDGFLDMDDQEFTIKSGSSFGYQDKTWGKQFTSYWFKVYGGQLSSNKPDFNPNKSGFLLGRGIPVVFGYPVGVRSVVSLIYNEFLYDFSYIVEMHHQEYHQPDNHNTRIVHLVTSNLDYKLEIVLNLALANKTLLSYPTPQGHALSLDIYHSVQGQLTLYSHDGLNKWTMIDTLTLREAIVEENLI